MTWGPETTISMFQKWPGGHSNKAVTAVSISDQNQKFFLQGFLHVKHMSENNRENYMKQHLSGGWMKTKWEWLKNHRMYVIILQTPSNTDVSEMSTTCLWTTELLVYQSQAYDHCEVSLPLLWTLSKYSKPLNISSPLVFQDFVTLDHLVLI